MSRAVITLILHSCYRLARLRMEDLVQWVIASACLVVRVALQTEVVLLFIVSGLLGFLYYGTLRQPNHLSSIPFMAALPLVVGASKGWSGWTPGKLLLFFLKAGSLTALVAVLSLVALARWQVRNPVLVAATALIGLIAFPLLKPTWIFVK